jgi:lysophospholipase L1-like esterase
MTNKSSRRNFLKQASLLSAAAMAVPAIVNAKTETKETSDNSGDGFTFLFQGDSITDGNRSRNLDWNHVLGHGYAYLISARLWYDHPAKNFHFFNRGVSGNKITDLAQRWQEDTIAIKPNLLSILIGVNDVQSALGGNASATTLSFQSDYRALLSQTKEQVPGVEFVICEPFILPVGKVKDNWDKFQEEIKGRQEVAQLIAKEFDAVYIPLQDIFNEALEKAPAGFWIWDGIHPMPAGHEMIAREWIKQVEKKFKFIK